jgi:hypothetical protein
MTNNQRFVIDKAFPNSPSKPLPPFSSPGRTRKTPFKIEKEIQEIILENLTESRPTTSQTERTDASVVSERTKLSITVSKDSRIMKTFSLDDDELLDTGRHDEKANIIIRVSPEKQSELADLTQSNVEAGSVKSDVTGEEAKHHQHQTMKGGSHAPHTTKATELRHKIQAQLKERLELREKHGGNIYGGDARQGTKKPLYTSKTSLQKQE